MDDRSVRELIIALRCLYEFPPVVQDAGVADFIVDLELLILRFCLEERCPVYESFRLDWVVVFQIESGDFEVSFEFVINGVLPEMVLNEM